MRRSLAIAAVASAVFGLAACSGGASGSPTSDDGSMTGTIKVWDLLVGGDKNWKAVMDQVDAQFEKDHPGAKVDRIAQPADPAAIHQLMQAAAQSKSGPDLIMIWAWGDVLTLKPSLVPIDKYISKEQRASLSGWEGVTFDDKTYGVPLGLQGLGLSYNTKLFEQAGLDPNNPPKSVDDLLKACTALNAAGITPIGGGNKEGYLSGWTTSTLYAGTATAAQAQKQATYTAPFNQAPFADASAGVMKLVDGKCFDKNMPATPWYPDGFQAFQDGKAAMQFTIYSQFAYMQDPKIGPDVKFIPSIANTRTPDFLPAGAMNVWAVTSFSQHKKLAAELALFQESAKYQQERLDKASYFPNNSGVTFDEFLKTHQGATPLVDMLKNGAKTFLPVHNMQDAKTNDIYQTQLELVMLGQTSLKDALQATEDSRKQQYPVLMGPQ
ncbi:ABC transporter substrate-binding protein [Microbacterium sp. ASV49]|uniref:Extracellular solute-binding protein n=1 Tax=Microbacterium candidum TaxID=3041922 RepID=A0ABT7MWB0_9MICO|nr:extracellular solute-binding protein [Microbacterium sp. ASV49]MDL9978739.1 extracellular solute-binding protein [Microbacterium sp. ASV49]